MSLNEMGKNAYYFSALALKDKFFIDCAKIKEDFVGLGALFFGSTDKLESVFKNNCNDSGKNPHLFCGKG